MNAKHLVILLLLLSLAACGKKGPVRPLLKSLPAAPRAAEIRQVGGELLLTMELPDRNQDGSPLSDLALIRILRRETPGGVCVECDEPTKVWREIDPEYPREATLVGQRLNLRDQDVLPGYGYRYRIVAITRSGQAGEAVTLVRVANEATTAPTAVSARGYDRMVRLAWHPPATLPPGWELLGYNLYRAQEAEPFTETPVNGVVIPEAHYDDIGPVNGIVYRYQVRSLLRKGDLTVESASSGEVAATPQLEE